VWENEGAVDSMVNMTEAAGVLIVDDEYSTRDSLCHWLARDAYRTGTARNGKEALQRLQESSWDVVLLDIRMPGMDGIELQRRMRQLYPELVVIMITAYSSVATAVRALKEGAFDYVTKPVDPMELSRLVRRAVGPNRLAPGRVRHGRRLEKRAAPDLIVGESPEMREVRAQIRSIADTEAVVLIHGETGTGKNLVARTIHANSGRRSFEFVPVNCEALSEGELFGHEKGAFTGARYRRTGMIELADGGTLFLDNISALPPQTQSEFLRVLVTRRSTRLGSRSPHRVDFRTICATSQDLEKRVQEGRFQADLHFRVNGIAIHLPPLRERAGDVPLLAEHFLREYSTQMRRFCSEFAPEAMDLLTRHSWPGNVRELANAVKRAVVVCTPPTIQREDLPISLSGEGGVATGDSLAEVRRAHIRRIIEQTGWNMTRAATLLQIDRKTLSGKIAKYGLRDQMSRQVEGQ
jgi:DNA-binding NtrC family response regulator